MTRKRTRHLRHDEKELWQQIAATAHPLRREQAREIVAHAADPKPTVRDYAPEPSLLAQFELGITANTRGASAVVTYAPPLGDSHVQMDAKSYGRMTRGKLVPEGRIDLHGMTMARAHPVLTRFILTAHGQGKRLVLVITGKGKDRDEPGPIPTKRGVLRHQVPDWLRMMPLAPLVLQITPAHLKHGGSGAYYVYLRRSR